jgi:hypothetical protein
MKGFRAFLSVVLLMFVAATLIPCSAQTAKAQDAGVDVQTHKFVPKGPVGQLPPGAQSMAAQKPQSGISATAIAQINALQQEKRSRTPVQKKIDSQVLATSRMMQNQPVADGIQYVYTDVDLDQDDNLVVDITAEVSDDLIKQMTAAGAKIIYSNDDRRNDRRASTIVAGDALYGAGICAARSQFAGFPDIDACHAFAVHPITLAGRGDKHLQQRAGQRGQ